MAKVLAVPVPRLKKKKKKKSGMYLSSLLWKVGTGRPLGLASLSYLMVCSETLPQKR